eukprot:5902357-Pleurochrysis_carterae.AAC.1
MSAYGLALDPARGRVAVYVGRITPANKLATLTSSLFGSNYYNTRETAAQAPTHAAPPSIIRSPHRPLRLGTLYTSAGGRDAGAGEANGDGDGGTSALMLAGASGVCGVRRARIAQAAHAAHAACAAHAAHAHRRRRQRRRWRGRSRQRQRRPRESMRARRRARVRADASGASGARAPQAHAAETLA